MRTNQRLSPNQRKAVAKAVPFPYWTIVYGATALFAFLFLLQFLRA